MIYQLIETNTLVFYNYRTIESDDVPSYFRFSKEFQTIDSVTVAINSTLDFYIKNPDPRRGLVFGGLMSIYDIKADS